MPVLQRFGDLKDDVTVVELVKIFALLSRRLRVQFLPKDACEVFHHLVSESTDHTVLMVTLGRARNSQFKVGVLVLNFVFAEKKRRKRKKQSRHKR